MVSTDNVKSGPKRLKPTKELRDAHKELAQSIIQDSRNDDIGAFLALVQAEQVFDFSPEEG